LKISIAKSSVYSRLEYTTIAEQKRSRLEHAQVIKWFGNLPTFENYHQHTDEKLIQYLIEDDKFI
jgi:hypothetical protein